MLYVVYVQQAHIVQMYLQRKAIPLSNPIFEIQFGCYAIWFLNEMKNNKKKRQKKRDTKKIYGDMYAIHEYTWFMCSSGTRVYGRD